MHRRIHAVTSYLKTLKIAAHLFHSSPIVTCRWMYRFFARQAVTLKEANKHLDFSCLGHSLLLHWTSQDSLVFTKHVPDPERMLHYISSLQEEDVPSGRCSWPTLQSTPRKRAGSKRKTLVRLIQCLGRYRIKSFHVCQVSLALNWKV